MSPASRVLTALAIVALLFVVLGVVSGDWPRIAGLFAIWLLAVCLIPNLTVILLTSLRRTRAAARYAGWIARHFPGAAVGRVCAMQAAHLFWGMRERAAAERYADLGMAQCEPKLHLARVRLVYAACVNVKGILALEAGRYREALDAFSRPLRMGLEGAAAHAPLFHANRAAALYGLGDFDGAVEAMRYALAIMPGVSQPRQRADATIIARYNGALALVESGRAAEALAETEAAVGENLAQPRLQALAWGGRGLALWRGGRGAEAAEAAFLEAERGMSADAPHLLRSVLGLRGRVRLERGDLDGAEADLQQALSGDEAAPGALHGLATLAALRGDEAQAGEWRRRLRRDVPESFWAAPESRP